MLEVNLALRDASSSGGHSQGKRLDRCIPGCFRKARELGDTGGAGEVKEPGVLDPAALEGPLT